VNLEWSGQEQIAASKAAVWAFINDPQKIASCLPDVQTIDVHDAHSFDATVKVAVGPVRGNLKFNITLIPADSGNHMDLKITGGGLGSVVNLLAGADLSENAATTTLDWKGSAQVNGPVATVGGRVLDAQAHKVIATTFENVKNAVPQTT
jgi:uncharacterized protein